MTKQGRVIGQNAGPPSGRSWLAQAASAAGALTLALVVVALLQPLFAFSLASMRAGTDLGAVRNNIRAAFEAGVLADDKVPKIWILRGGHQFTECVGLNVAI